MAETKEHVWNSYTEEEKQELQNLSDSYRDFLTKCKTERESVKEAVRLAKKAGYKDLAAIIKSGKKLAAGDKVFAVCMKKAIALFNIGTEPLAEGMAILGAHIDTCPARRQAESALRRRRLGISGHALLRRHQEVSVGYRAAGNSWRSRPKRRYDCRHHDRRG